METYPEMSKSFKTWLSILLVISAIAAVAGFVAGAMGNHWAGLCIFLPCAIICFGLLMLLFSGKRSGFFTVAAVCIAIIVILISGNPFGYAENALMMNLLISLPYALAAAGTALFAVREWKQLK